MGFRKYFIKCVVLCLLFGALSPSFQSYALQPLSASNVQGEISKIVSSPYNTLAIKDDGTLWAWGTNSYGQLGTDDIYESFFPMQIMHLDEQGEESGLIAIDIAIRENTWGRTFFAVDPTGHVWAWGSNSAEVIDNNKPINESIPNPQKVAGLSNITAIAAGKDHVLALDEAGYVWSWGMNENGPLGRGHIDNRQSTPGKVLTTDGSELTTIKAIAASEMHSLALDENGAVYSWGYNNKGQLGDGTTIRSNRATVITGLPKIDTIVTGHSSFSSVNSFNFALSETGSVYAWGDNTHGQLGTGSNDVELSPVEITDLFDATQISTGLQHTLALKSDGTVWAAGRLLSQTDWDNKTLTFMQVSGLEHIQGISAGAFQNFVLTSDGHVRSWGANEIGVLGHGHASFLEAEAKPILQLEYYDTGPKPMENITTNWVKEGRNHYLEVNFSLPFPMMYSVINFELYSFGGKHKGEDPIDDYYVFSSISDEVRLNVGSEVSAIYELYIYVERDSNIYDGELYIVAKPDIFASGSGTSSDDPWIIETPEQLNELRNYGVSPYAKTYFKLGADIDMTSYLAEGGAGYERWGDLGWEPIGIENLPFTGVFDGDGFIITGLSNNRAGANPLDLFGFVESDDNIINVRILNNETGLSKVTLGDAGTLSHISPQQYEASLPYEVDEISIIAEMNDPKASLLFKIEGSTTGGQVSGAIITSDSIPLSVGENTLELIVTAEDGITKQVYSIIITRESKKMPPSTPDDNDRDVNEDKSEGKVDDDRNGKNKDDKVDNVVSEYEPQDEKHDGNKNAAVDEENSVNLVDIAGHWAEEEIRSLILRGGIKGYRDATFRPDNPITRAEFVSIIVHTLALQQTDEVQFLDTSDHWARHIIAAAYTRSIINGYNEWNFGPDDPITREQMASIIVKAFHLNQLESDVIFTDDSSISNWARTQMETAIAHGIINGFTDGTVRAKAYTTRAEAAAVVMRALSLN